MESENQRWKKYKYEISMTHSRDKITVGSITLVYSYRHHGWITPCNQIIKNQIVAQLIAEQMNTNLKLSLAANGLAA